MGGECGTVTTGWVDRGNDPFPPKPGWVGGSCGSFLHTNPRRRRFCSRENEIRNRVNNGVFRRLLRTCPSNFECWKWGGTGGAPLEARFSRRKNGPMPKAFPPRSGARGGTKGTFFARGGGIAGMTAGQWGREAEPLAGGQPAMPPTAAMSVAKGAKCSRGVATR